MKDQIDQAIDNATTGLEWTSAEPAFVRRIRLRARRRVLWLRHLWSTGSSPLDLNIAISNDEVDRVLADPHAMRAEELAFYAIDPASQDLADPIRAADSDTAAHLGLGALRQRFGLSAPECDLLSLAVAVEIDPGLRRVYGYLNDDAAACHTTPLLAAQLFGWPEPLRFSPDCALVRWLLARPSETGQGAWSLVAPWVADAAAPGLLIDGILNDPALGAAVDLNACLSMDEPCLYDPELAEMHRYILSMRGESAKRVAENVRPVATQIELVASEGAGKRTLARQLCAALRSPILIADAAKLLAGDVAGDLAAERVTRVARIARLSGAVAYWHDAGANASIWNTLGDDQPETILATTSALPSTADPAVARKSVALKSLTQAQRRTLWQSLSDHPVPPPISDWLLTPGEIARAAAVAPAGPDAVLDVCKKAPKDAAGSLLTTLPRPYTWDDMVLPPSLRQHLGELEAQTRLRWEVYEERGFQRLCSGGRGITALFAGPSGTGKTMAAQVLGRALDMDIYRVDLASVMSKYIGETEKNLKLIFDSCDRANVLLFFDEADALFGQRTQVKDAHDRFANIEIDYLLQRMEQFDGIAVLATNRKGEIDKAFLRRIRFIVDFIPPGPEERLALWHRALPEIGPDGAKLTGEIGWRLLADKLNMTGADIKSAVLSAAFLAQSDGEPIAMRHLLHAARREMTKHGLVLRDAELGGHA